MVCDQRFVLRMPSNLPLDAAAPLLCAGITVYSPMRGHALDKPGLRLGVLGLGGLGSMAVRFGAAFGCEVTVISTSPGKEAEARALGAKHFLLSTDKAAMAAAAGSLDGIVDTVSAKHDLGTYLDLLDVDGKLVLVGVPPEPMALNAFSIIGGGKAVIGSLIGGLPETQEMLDYWCVLRQRSCAAALTRCGAAAQRQAQHREHDREDQDRLHQRGVRAADEERRQRALRDRYGVAQEVSTRADTSTFF